MEEVYSDLNDFEKRLKVNRNLEDQVQSSSDEEDTNVKPRFTTEADVLKEKNRILMEKLFKSEKQVNEYKEMVDAISNGGKADLKDKKLIDLAKKNRSLQLQVESLKTKAAKAAEFALKLKKEKDLDETNSQMSPKKSNNILETQSMMTGIDSDKKFKDQQLKGELDKAIKCLERETGEIVSLDDMVREDSNWKGRAQKIEVLKSQIKKLKEQNFGTSMMNDGLSVISETPSVFTGKITHAEKNLTKLNNNRTNELEQLRKELEETKDELNNVKTKYKAAVARRDTLENQMKDVKSEFTSKFKILIEKTENDDKLIQMLKAEIKRIESAKGVKSQLSSGGISTTSSVKSQQQDTVPEFAKMKAENGRLKNQIKCLEIELEQKEDKIKNLLTNCVGAPDERFEEKELRIAELEDKVESLEKENFRIRQDMNQTKDGFGRGGGQPGPTRTKDESDKIIKELSKQNAMLRRKLDDALERLGNSTGFKQ
ncbi:UNKNOWN [Stylonychia lemnae]|uniref:Coiled-coil domain-containing protein 13 n=1 Tax=Stylonychia lemnae TaxID=5949 RepID=A0A077ZTX0_STYLE|nr:UNKNOWN [Stylonychia lemnae]|eukprot:CDW71896.1 UNKNOWN [Stylonychia lemnae]